MPGPGAPRGPYRNTAARRAEIVRAAEETFAAEGYEGASLRGVAARVGISHTGLLHHFRSKEELLAAVLDKRDTDERAHFEDNPVPHGMDGFVSALRQVLARHRAAPELMRLWAILSADAIRPDHPANDYIGRRYLMVREELTKVVEALQAEGELDRSLDSGSVAALIAAVLDGIQVQWLFDPELDIDAAVTTLFAALRATPADADGP